MAATEQPQFLVCQLLGELLPNFGRERGCPGHCRGVTLRGMTQSIRYLEKQQVGVE